MQQLFNYVRIFMDIRRQLLIFLFITYLYRILSINYQACAWEMGKYQAVDKIKKCEIIMYNKITNQPKQPNLPQPPSSLRPATRTYSFSEQQQQQQSWGKLGIVEFVEDVGMIVGIHEMGLGIGSMMRVNCSDVGTVEQALREDGSLTKQVRDRMAKYLRVIHIATSGISADQYGDSQPIGNNSHLQDYATNTAYKEDPKQVQATAFTSTKHNTNNNRNTSIQIGNNTNMEQQSIKLTVSRKIPISQPQFQLKKQKNKAKDQSPINKHNKSLAHSQASESKHFHKIQLKSVKRIDKKQVPQSFSKDKQKQKQRQKLKQRQKQKQKKKEQIVKEEKKIQNNKDGNTNTTRRFTISQRQAKNTKTLSYHVDNMKSNSRLKVSRVRQQSLNKTFNENPKNLSKSHYKDHSPSVSPNRHKNESHMAQNSKNTNKQQQNPIDMGSNTNLVYETVQKSTDFLQMLKMMNQE